MIFAALAHAFATLPAVNSNRSNFSLGTSPFRQLKSISGAGSGYVARLTTALELNLSNERSSARRSIHLVV